MKYKVRCDDCGASFTEVYPDGLEGSESFSDPDDPKPCDCASQYTILEEVWSHPAFATREEFEQRLADVISVEQEGEVKWWYLSFTDEEFLGGLYIPARGVVEASRMAHGLGINPGGQVLGWEIDVEPEVFDKNVPPADRLRLLTKEEVMAHGEESPS